MHNRGETVDDQSESPQPLLRLEEVRLKKNGLGCKETILSSGNSLVLAGQAGALLPALCGIEDLISGEILIVGESVPHLLRNQRAGYAPISLPLVDRTGLGEALTMSARLVGADKGEVELKLERCHLLAHRKKKLGELTRLQSRLAGLCHALCGQPEILLLEDLFHDLDEAEAEVIEAILDVELRGRKWIFALEPQCPPARSIFMLADEVISSSGNRLLPPMSPKDLRQEGFWVICSGNVSAFQEHLKSLDAQVVRSPHPGTLRVHEISGLEIFRAARAVDTQIIELSPTSTADRNNTHGRKHG